MKDGQRDDNYIPLSRRLQKILQTTAQLTDTIAAPIKPECICPDFIINPPGRTPTPANLRSNKLYSHSILRALWFSTEMSNAAE